MKNETTSEGTKMKQVSKAEEFLRVCVLIWNKREDCVPSKKNGKRFVFWAESWIRFGKTIKFFACDTDGESDIRSLEAGNGGTVRMVICSVDDVVFVRPAAMNYKYGELEVINSGDAAEKLKEIVGKIA